MDFQTPFSLPGAPPEHGRKGAEHSARGALNSSSANYGRSAAGSVFGLGEEGRCVLLHQSVQRGLFRAVAIVVDRGAIRRPLGLPAAGLHDGLPKW
jgi:hypothetical protein